MNDEAENLALLHVIETHDADKAVAVLRAASFDFIQHFVGGGSVEQRKLPQRPVVLSRFGTFAEFHTRNVALIQNVLDLTGNLGIREGGQVGESLETALFR